MNLSKLEWCADFRADFTEDKVKFAEKTRANSYVDGFLELVYDILSKYWMLHSIVFFVLYI